MAQPIGQPFAWPVTSSPLLTEEPQEEFDCGLLLIEGCKFLAALGANPSPFPDNQDVSKEVTVDAQGVEARHVVLRFNAFNVDFAGLDHH